MLRYIADCDGNARDGCALMFLVGIELATARQLGAHFQQLVKAYTEHYANCESRHQDERMQFHDPSLL